MPATVQALHFDWEPGAQQQSSSALISLTPCADVLVCLAYHGILEATQHLTDPQTRST